MEKSPVNPANKVELPEAEQSIEHFSLSEQEKNIQEVFKLSPKLKEIACEWLGIENDTKVQIINQEIDNTNGNVYRSFNAYYKGNKIIDTKHEVKTKSLFKLCSLKDGTTFVSAVLLPEKLRGQGLYSKILQETANVINQKIKNSSTVFENDLEGDYSISPSAKKVWNKLGNEILPNHEAEKLYAKYLETIFPESKVKDIVWHGTRGEWYKTEQFNTNLAGTSSNNKENTDGVYFIKYKQAASAFGDKKTIFPAIIDIKNPNIVPLTDFNKSWTSKEKYSQMKNGDGIIAEQEKSPEEYYKEALDKYNEAQKDEDEMARRFSRKPGGPEDFYEEQLSTTYVVYNPLQIHILGSKSDIEKFKEFVSKNKKNI